MNALESMFTKYVEIEKAAVSGGHTRYWTELQPVGLDWGLIFMTTLVVAFVTGLVFATYREIRKEVAQGIPLGDSLRSHAGSWIVLIIAVATPSWYFM